MTISFHGRSSYDDMIIDLISKILNSEFFANNKLLVSNITDDNFLDIDILTEIPCFNKISVTADEIRNALSSCLLYQKLLNSKNQLFLPFIINNKGLLISGDDINCKEINKIIYLLTGNKMISQRKDKSFKCHFETSDDMILCWRALELIYMEGTNIYVKALVVKKKHYPNPIPRCHSMLAVNGNRRNRNRKRRSKSPVSKLSIILKDNRIL